VVKSCHYSPSKHACLYITIYKTFQVEFSNRLLPWHMYKQGHLFDNLRHRCCGD